RQKREQEEPSQRQWLSRLSQPPTRSPAPRTRRVPRARLPALTDELILSPLTPNCPRPTSGAASEAAQIAEAPAVLPRLFPGLGAPGPGRNGRAPSWDPGSGPGEIPPQRLRTFAP